MHNSAYAAQFGCRGAIAPIADYGLLRTAADIAEERGLRCTVGNLLSSDTFYDDDKTANAAWIKMGVLGIEMEAAALYLNAMRAARRRSPSAPFPTMSSPARRRPPRSARTLSAR